MKTKAYHHGDLRNQLTRVAAKMIEKRQDVSFTLREVSAQAGVSHAAAYRHFGGKRDILAAVAEAGFVGLQKELLQASREHPKDVRAELMSQGQGYVRYALTHPGYFRAMFHADLGDLEDCAELKGVAAQAFGSLLDCVTRGVAAGAFAESEPMSLAILAWSTVHGLATLLINGRIAQPAGASLSVADLTQSVMHLMMVGVDARKGQ